MIRPSLLSIVLSASLGACSAASGATPPAASYVAAHLVQSPAPSHQQASGIHRTPTLFQPWRHSLPHPPTAVRPLEQVAAAKRAAIREPEVSDYAGAAQVYPWADGALYRLYTAPEEVSDVALQPGEALVSVAAGDTSRWVIADTTSGSGAARQVHILVKPSASELRTNLVIATDRRVYHVEVESTPRTAMTSIAWTYPQDALLALRASATAPQQPVAAGIAVDRLDFNYRIDGDRPPWRPVRAFDDGHQVFIEFPPTLGDGEAPPLFVRGEGGRAELVNYRVRGRYYVVDRLFSAAELRLGERRQQVVRIIREGRKAS